MEAIKKHAKHIRIGMTGLLLLFILPHVSNFSVEGIVSYTPAYLPLAAVVFFLIYAVKGMVMVIPIPLLYMAAGVVFPMPYALIVTVIGAAIAMTVGYLNGRSLGEAHVVKFLNKHPRVKDIIEDHRENIPMVVFMTRLIPLPFDVMSILHGAMNISFFKYLLMSLLGILPKAIPIVITATHISNPLSPQFIIPFVASLVVMFLIFILQKLFLHKKISNM